MRCPYCDEEFSLLELFKESCRRNFRKKRKEPQGPISLMAQAWEAKYLRDTNRMISGNMSAKPGGTIRFKRYSPLDDKEGK